MSAPLLTPEQIASVCLSYRHDFGLLEGGDRHRLMFMAREWERAMSHEIRAPLLAEIKRLNAERDAAMADAERYRWLRDEALFFGADGVRSAWCVIGTSADDASPVWGEELDAAIDAARSST